MFFLTNSVIAEAVSATVLSSTPAAWAESFDQYACLGPFFSRSSGEPDPALASQMVYLVDFGLDYLNKNSDLDYIAYSDVSESTVGGDLIITLSGASAPGGPFTNVINTTIPSPTMGHSPRQDIICISSSNVVKYRYYKIQVDYAAFNIKALSCLWAGKKIAPSIFPERISVSNSLESVKSENISTIAKFIPMRGARTAFINLQYKGLPQSEANDLLRIKNLDTCMISSDTEQGFMFGSKLLYLRLNQVISRRTFREPGKYDVLISGDVIL